MTIEATQAALKERISDLVAFLYPDARGDWKAVQDGNVTVWIGGLKTGMWRVGEADSRDLLALWAHRYNFHGNIGWEEQAARDAEAWLNASGPRATGDRTAVALVTTEGPPRRTAARIQYPPDFHREFPQAPDAEKGVLSSILLAPKDVIGLTIESGVTKESFYIPSNGEIYGALLELWNENRPIDFITIAQYLRDRNKLDTIGGASALNELFVYLPTAANAGYYIEILLEKAILRDIIKVCNEYSARSYEEQDNAAGLLDEVETKIFALSNGRLGIGKGEVSAKESTMEAIGHIERLYENRGRINGLATGFAELDQMLDGLAAPNLYVIAARPSMGKTALAMNMAEHIAVDLGKPIGFFSLEMSRQQLFQRGLCSLARVNSHSVRSGFLSERDFPALTAAAARLAGSSLWVDDRSGITIQDMRAKARRWRKDRDIRALFIDYFQITGTSKKQDRRDLELADVSTGCKEMAKELGIPVVLLAQLNRKVEDRQSGRPRMSDLKECGKLEEDADVVGMLHREEYYAETEEAKAAAVGKATLIIGKNRNGPTGDVPLTFLREFTRFETRATGPEPA